MPDEIIKTDGACHCPRPLHAMAPPPPAIIRHGSWLPVLVPSFLLHGLFLLILLVMVPTCLCRPLEQPPEGSSSSSRGKRLQLPWGTTLAVLLPAVVLLALGEAACCLRRRKRWGDGNKPHRRSVNGGMTRSDQTVAPDGDAGADGPSPTADGPGQFGCARRGQQEEPHGRRPGSGTKVMREFDYDVLADAAEGFSGSRSSKLELGRSLSGAMFRGTLVSDEGLETAVAIKVFHHRFKEEARQYVSEDLKGVLLRHRNLLCPLGYCMRQRKLYVVYEYMVNRSLDEQIFEANPNHEVLSWSRRFRIIDGVATGLHHLRSHGSVHGAVKASNVLLDQDMGARLGDFGYSRAVCSISFKGSPYLAPECWNAIGASIEPTFEMDVFYLGAVILEAVCGRRICNTRAPNSGFWFLADWVGKLYAEGRVLEAVDAALAGEFNRAEAEKLLLLGMKCSNPDPKQRPSAEEVLSILSGTMSPLTATDDPVY